MPLTSAICSLSVFAALLTLPAAGVVIAAAPATNDICAVLGALIASVLTLIEARKKDRSIGHTISVFLGTASVGAFLPGLAVQIAVLKEWLSAETAAELSWHAWSVAGLVFGMNAWWLLHGVNCWLQRRAEKYFSHPDDHPLP
jgi:peptidoglycan/LPS O-acetylase OafA/YrhL